MKVPVWGKVKKWFRREDRRIPPNILQLYKYSTDLYRKGLHFNYSLKFESQIHCHISSIQHDHTPSNPRTSLVWKEAASVDRLAPTWRTPARLGSSRVAWRSFLEKSASIWQRKTQIQGHWIFFSESRIQFPVEPMMCQMLILQIKEKTDLIRLDLQSTTTIAITWCMLTVEDPVSSLSSGNLSAKDSGQSLTSPACAFPALLYIRAWKSHGFTKIRALDLGVGPVDTKVSLITAPGFKES